MPGKMILSIALIFLCMGARAEIKTKIEKINTTVKQAGRPPFDCVNCGYIWAGQDDDPTASMRSCVESICPAPELSMSAVYDKVIDRASKPDAMFDREIAPLIAATVKEAAKEKLAQSQAMLKWLKNAKDLSEPEDIRIFNFMMAMRTFSNFQLGSENGKPVVDAEKSKAMFVSSSDEEFKKQVQIGNKILNAFMDKAILTTDPARIQLYYPGDNFKARVNEVLSAIESKARMIAASPEFKSVKDLSEFKKMIAGESLRTRFASAEQINPDLIQELNRTYSVTNLFVSIATDPQWKGLLNSHAIDIKSVAAELGMERMLHERIEKQKTVLLAKNVTSPKCKIAFAMAQEGLPTRKQVEDFKKRIEPIKAKFLTKTKSLMCSDIGPKYENEVRGWTANLPLTRDQHVANIKASLSRDLQNSKSWKDRFDESEKSPSRDAYYAIGVASMSDDYNAPTESVDDVCDNLMPNILPDATRDLSNGFVAGPMVIAHENAEGVCHHELGHKLFHFMANQKDCDKSRFEKIRSCLHANHSESMPANQAQYESEDWADLISSLVYDKANFACLFARKIRDEDYAILSLRNPDSSDPHSSDLFRLLHLTFLKNGKIPEQCDRALAALGEKANFKDCLQP